MSTPYPVTPQIKSYSDKDGSPLNGYLYFGNPGTNPELIENRVQVYWDVAGTQPAAQPIRVSSGYAVRGGTPANVFAVGDFSASAKTLAGVLVYTVPNSTDLQLAVSIVALNAASAVTVADTGAYYTGADVEAVLQEVGASLASITLGAIPTGVMMDYCGTTAPTGYVLGSGRTIGNAASSATERNHADTAALYTQSWNSSTNTELPIQDSAGNPTTRGASAAADFAANKRLPLPDCRGRIRGGKDNMGGTTASRITNAGCGIVGTTQFAAGGTQTYVLVEAALPAHVHTGPTHTHAQADHVHSVVDHTHTGPSHTHSTSDHVHTTADHTHSTSDHSHTGPAHTHGTSDHAHSGPAHTHSTSDHAHSGPSHAHSGPAHTHSTSDHSHTGPSHTHIGPSHDHTITHTHDISHVHGTEHNVNTTAFQPGAQTSIYNNASAYTAGAVPSTSAGSSSANSGLGGAWNTSAAGTGSTGLAGAGLTGAEGTGSTGLGGTGSTGLAGLGSTGSEGTGSTGLAGLGSTGSAGTGSTGLAGLGSTGAAGTGSTGLAGAGLTGSEGTGSTGAAGLTATGSQTTTPSTGNNTAANTGSVGSGTAHLNVQPMIMFTVIIKL